ncbi:MAG: hypothetical protein QXE06_02825 [Candidatus Bathyarchaeia archaeon]
MLEATTSSLPIFIFADVRKMMKTLKLYVCNACGRLFQAAGLRPCPYCRSQHVGEANRIEY